MDTGGIGTAASSGLTLTEVDLNTDFSISSPSFGADTGPVTWAQVNALRVGVAASSVALQAGVVGRTRVTVSVVSISTNTNSGESVVGAVGLQVAVLHQSVRVTRRLSFVAEVSGKSLRTGADPTAPPAAGSVITHAVHTPALFVAVLSVFAAVGADVTGYALEARLTGAGAITADAVGARSFVEAGVVEASDAGFTVRTKEAFTALCCRFGGVAVFGAAFAQNRVRIRDEVVAVRQVFLHVRAPLGTAGLIKVTAVNTRAKSDLVLGDVTAVRHYGNNGGRDQQSVNHVDDTIGRHEVGAHKMDALLPEHQLAVVGDRNSDELIGHGLDPRKNGQLV